MIEMIFVLSRRCNLEPHAKFLAIHLLDQYSGCLFWELVSSSPQLNDAAMKQVREKTSSQIKLVLATCLQIASKVDLYKTGLDVEQV